MENKLNDLVYTIADRAYGYTFLKNLFFVEPEKSYLQGLLKEDHVSDFPYSRYNEKIKTGLDGLKKSLEDMDLDNENVISKLRWDYTRMFIGPDSLPAPPWESSYVNKDKLLFQEETLQVRRSYLKYNFVGSNYPHEADDHIALELDFMSKLSVKVIESIEANKELENILEILIDQKSFLEEHLNKWVFEFAKKIKECAETDYFIFISDILMEFIKEDCKSLDENISTIRKLK